MSSRIQPEPRGQVARRPAAAARADTIPIRRHYPCCDSCQTLVIPLIRHFSYSSSGPSCPPYSPDYRLKLNFFRRYRSPFQFMAFSETLKHVPSRKLLSSRASPKEARSPTARPTLAAIWSGTASSPQPPGSPPRGAADSDFQAAPGHPTADDTRIPIGGRAYCLKAWKGCYPSDREQRCILNVDTAIPS